MVTTAVVLTACLAMAAQGAESADGAQDATAVRLPGFVVALIDDVNVAARESGVLTAVHVQEGQLVKKGDVLGQVDDSDAKLRRLIAKSELISAEEQAKSDASLKAAEATVGVARAEYEGTMEIKQRSPDAISDFEVRRKRLTHERSVYESINAQLEHKVAELTVDTRSKQLQAVENEIKRRQIESPLDGVVERRLRDEGEWVQAGEPVFRVVRMDRLRVEGLLSSEEFMPADVAGRTVIIEVKTPHGIEKRQARISFVSTVIDAGRDFRVFAEFDNPRQSDGQWHVLPGLRADVTVLLKKSQPAAKTGK